MPEMVVSGEPGRRVVSAMDTTVGYLIFWPTIGGLGVGWKITKEKINIHATLRNNSIGRT